MSQEIMDEELKQLEEELRKFAPSPLSGDVLSRMVEVMDKWEDVPESADKAESNVIAFSTEKNRSSWGPMWAAAAAVAILGGVLGVMSPRGSVAGSVVAKDLGVAPALRQASLVPVGAQRKVSSLDTGKVSDKNGLEHQVIRVVRQEQVDFRGSNNVGLKISRPKVDYYVIPVSY